jgi:signal transduction histidine kinase
VARGVRISVIGAWLLLLGGTASAQSTRGLIENAIPERAWFETGFAITVLALFWALYQLRLRQLARTLNVRFDERVSERLRIARDLHDTLLQSFQGLMLRFQSARDLLPDDAIRAGEALDAALERADQALVEGRDAIQNLRSTDGIAELGAAMTALADEFRRASAATASVAFRTSVEGTPRDLHPLVRDDAYRIAGEALRNAYRHAQATRIEAEVTYGARALRVRIRDNGRGIQPEYLETAPPRHWGLVSMRERASQIGSELSVWSGSGAGTEVELRIPSAIAYGAPRRARLVRGHVAQEAAR